MKKSKEECRALEKGYIKLPFEYYIWKVFYYPFKSLFHLRESGSFYLVILWSFILSVAYYFIFEGLRGCIWGSVSSLPYGEGLFLVYFLSSILAFMILGVIIGVAQIVFRELERSYLCRLDCFLHFGREFGWDMTVKEVQCGFNACLSGVKFFSYETTYRTVEDFIRKGIFPEEAFIIDNSCFVRFILE